MQTGYARRNSGKERQTQLSEYKIGIDEKIVSI